MGTPAVSVIIPTYNRPDSLCELLETLASQTYRDLEVVVVNDAGSDVGFVRDLYPELPITVVTLERNAGHVVARNVGLDYARGEFILLCDDDDLLLPGHVERMMREIADADLVYSDAIIFRYIRRGRTRIPTSWFLFAYEHDPAEMRRFSTFIASGCLYRRRLHEAIGRFDPWVYHYWDWDFYLRVSERHRVKRVPEAGVLYAFGEEGDHLSAQLEQMRPFLDRLAAKHGLGPLPVKNFFLLLDEPEVAKRRADSVFTWDGRPVVSRWARLERQNGRGRSGW